MLDCLQGRRSTERIMDMATFGSWLTGDSANSSDRGQRDRTDPIGVLARYWKIITPGRISSPSGMQRHLERVTAEDEGAGWAAVLEDTDLSPWPSWADALKAALAEYQGHRIDAARAALDATTVLEPPAPQPASGGRITLADGSVVDGSTGQHHAGTTAHSIGGCASCTPRDSDDGLHIPLPAQPLQVRPEDRGQAGWEQQTTLPSTGCTVTNGGNLGAGLPAEDCGAAGREQPEMATDGPESPAEFLPQRKPYVARPPDREPGGVAVNRYTGWPDAKLDRILERLEGIGATLAEMSARLANVERARGHSGQDATVLDALYRLANFGTGAR